MKTRYPAIRPYRTRDGSTIRELLHPQQHAHLGSRNQSLAEATVAVGAATCRHRHQQSEELYHITGGHGQMLLGDETFPVEAGDTVCIPPGTPHAIRNSGSVPLTLLCCCAPPYRHDDTELLADE